MIFLRPSGAITIAFAAFPLLSAVGRWQMTLFLTAHRRDHRLAAPLTASLVGARWTRDAAFREGRRLRRRHHHDSQCCLVDLVVVYRICVVRMLRPQMGSRLVPGSVGPMERPF